MAFERQDSEMRASSTDAEFEEMMTSFDPILAFTHLGEHHHTGMCRTFVEAEHGTTKDCSDLSFASARPFELNELASHNAFHRVENDSQIQSYVMKLYYDQASTYLASFNRALDMHHSYSTHGQHNSTMYKPFSTPAHPNILNCDSGIHHNDPDHDQRDSISSKHSFMPAPAYPDILNRENDTCPSYFKYGQRDGMQPSVAAASAFSNTNSRDADMHHPYFNHDHREGMLWRTSFATRSACPKTTNGDFEELSANYNHDHRDGMLWQPVFGAASTYANTVNREHEMHHPSLDCGRHESGLWKPTPAAASAYSNAIDRGFDERHRDYDYSQHRGMMALASITFNSDSAYTTSNLYGGGGGEEVVSSYSLAKSNSDPMVTNDEESHVNKASPKAARSKRKHVSFAATLETYEDIAIDPQAPLLSDTPPTAAVSNRKRGAPAKTIETSEDAARVSANTRSKLRPRIKKSTARTSTTSAGNSDVSTNTPHKPKKKPAATNMISFPFVAKAKMPARQDFKVISEDYCGPEVPTEANPGTSEEDVAARKCLRDLIAKHWGYPEGYPEPDSEDEEDEEELQEEEQEEEVARPAKRKRTNGETKPARKPKRINPTITIICGDTGRVQCSFRMKDISSGPRLPKPILMANTIVMVNLILDLTGMNRGSFWLLWDHPKKGEQLIVRDHQLWYGIRWMVNAYGEENVVFRTEMQCDKYIDGHLLTGFEGQNRQVYPSWHRLAMEE